MKKITIIVDSVEDVDDILEVLTDAEEDGELDFAFGVTVEDHDG